MGCFDQKRSMNVEITRSTVGMYSSTICAGNKLFDFLKEKYIKTRIRSGDVSSLVST